MGILWIILIGFVAGIIARLVSRGPNNPSGFILTTVLGIAGAFLATWIGQLITAPVSSQILDDPHHDIIAGQRRHAEAADEISRAIDAAKPLEDRLAMPHTTSLRCILLEAQGFDC